MSTPAELCLSILSNAHFPLVRLREHAFLGMSIDVSGWFNDEESACFVEVVAPGLCEDATDAPLELKEVGTIRFDFRVGGVVIPCEFDENAWCQS